MKNAKILFGVLGVMLFTLILLPSNVSAKANFDELLTDGKLVVNSVKTTINEMAYTVIYSLGDNVMLLVLLGTMSLIGIIGVLIHLIKRKNTLG